MNGCFARGSRETAEVRFKTRVMIIGKTGADDTIMTKCLVCESVNIAARRAVVAPFLASRIWGKFAVDARLESCKECSFRFFSPRLTDSEQAKLYAGYRDERYQQDREATEPWYTRAFNASFDSEEALTYRRSFISTVFEKELAGKDVTTVLDFGGHRGELIVGLLHDAREFVYDVSGVTPIDGVSIVATPQDCKAHNFDLIVCSNVMEHVAEPRDTVGEIEEASGPDSLVFIEVPEELPLGFWSKLKRLVQFVLLVLRRPPVAKALLRRGMLYQMHEHVNCFSPRSLTQLLVTSGWQIESTGAYTVSGVRAGPLQLASSRMLWAFAKPPRTAGRAM